MRYIVLDVFSSVPLAGNQLAVVLDADHLDAPRMQSIAREFNLSETVFVMKPERPVHSARIRIFTPTTELPFAGHPTVGCAVCLAVERSGGTGGQEMVIVLEETVGPVRCGVFLKDARLGHATFDVPRRPEAVAHAFDREAIAEALCLMPAEVGFENHEPSAFGAGVQYSFVPVRDLQVIARAAPNPAAWKRAFPAAAAAVYVYCRETMGVGNQFHARMFAPEIGITEDPATGSAAAAFPGVIQRFDGLTTGLHRMVIEQGYEMKRPSLIVVEAEFESGAISATRIGGDAVIVAEGNLRV